MLILFLDFQKELSDHETSGEGRKWWIPISVVTEGSINVASTSVTIWLPPKEKEMFVAGLPNLPRWVLLNNKQATYARVNYDHASWMALARQLKQNHTVFPAVTRAQLLDDAYHLFGLGGWLFVNLYSRQRWNLYIANISEPSHKAQKSPMLLISSSVHKQNAK